MFRVHLYDHRKSSVAINTVYGEMPIPMCSPDVHTTHAKHNARCQALGMLQHVCLPLALPNIKRSFTLQFVSVITDEGFRAMH